MLRAVLIALARWLYHMGRDAAILAYIISSMLPRVLHSFPRIMGGEGVGNMFHTQRSQVFGLDCKARSYALRKDKEVLLYTKVHRSGVQLHF